MEAVCERPKVKKKNKVVNKDPPKNAECTEKSEKHVLENKIVESTESGSEEKFQLETKTQENTIVEHNADEKENIIEPALAEVIQNTVPEQTQAIESCDSLRYEKLLNLNKEILNEMKLEDIKTIETKPTTIKIEEKPKDTIKPYTEQQLEALYHNSELDTLETFNSQYVEAELKGLAVKQHPLYELLFNYLKVCEKITGNSLEIDQIRKEYNTLQCELWTMTTATVSGCGECQDGQIVTANHKYNKSIFHRSIFSSIVRILGNVQKLVYENHILYTYSADELRLQIECFLQGVIHNCVSVTQISKNSPVLLNIQEAPPHMKPYINEVRLCISVLFAFQRKLIREEQFLKETRCWLRQLIAVLLRLATFQDHLFILNHILRCPAGVGTWGSNFIQLPLRPNSNESPFASYEVNHILTILATILMPIKSRDKFLEDIAQNKDTAQDALWVLVDSEGEEDDEVSGTSLKENDLVSLLNQLPLDSLFRKLLLISQRDARDVYDASIVDENHLLRFLSFCTVLLKIFHKGLSTYPQERYKQFSKRLSRFIRHIVQYATDQWEIFLCVHKNSTDKSMLERLQVEYDAFFLRAIYYLYSSQKLGAWQFLAVIPYNAVIVKTLWKIYYFLHKSDVYAKNILDPLDMTEYSEKLWDDELRQQFEEKLTNLEDGEIYYLLNTFANMALARDSTDMNFIFDATMDLLEVGFINNITQDVCSKSVLILLTHLTSKHPHLLSNIFKTVKENITKIDSLVLYLYEELPITIWTLNDIDLEGISQLVLNHPSSSIENKLGRMILSRLNWDLISHEMQCEVAILCIKTAEQEPNCLQWAWQMILRLKLHISDKHFTEIGRIQEPERYDVLIKGIRENNPIANFTVLLMTTWGHLVPLICTKGLPLVVSLINQQKHEAALFALYQIVPLFITSQECLINYEKFQEILLNLLNADRGYISMAKSFIGQQNTVLQQFGNMVETQIVNFAYYGLDSPRCLVRLWINSFVSIPNWNKDYGVLYLLDVIVRTAFFHKDALEMTYSILRDLHQCGTPQEQTGMVGSFFKWVSNTNSNSSFILNSLSNCTWLAYIIIDLDHQERDCKTGLWRAILTQLSKQKKKVNVDAAIKSAADSLKVPSYTSGYLCIYRWAQQALDTPMGHPLLPLLWQKFFELYLERIPISTAAEMQCLGDRFFDGLVNFAFFKKIKRSLQDLVKYYASNINECDDSKKDFYKACHRVFEAYLLWLEEPILKQNNLLLQNLPQQYEISLLGCILNGTNYPWYDYLDYEIMQQEQNLCIKIWRQANFREKKNINKPLSNPGNSIESTDPVERILRRLQVYDSPKSAPDITFSAPVIPQIDFSGKENFFKSLDTIFKTLHQFAHTHLLKLSEQKALDCSYQELIPQLYRSVLNKVRKKVPCRGKNQAVHCSGAALIVLEMHEAQINERINHQIETNRNAYESLISQALQNPAINLCSSAVCLQKTISTLQVQLKCNPQTLQYGVDLFYHILSQINEETSAYLPSKTLFSTCLDKLGQSHICGIESEMPKLLQKILKEPNLSGYLAPHFSPSNVGTTSLIHMYQTISKETSQKYDVAFALLSKFEIDSWLKSHQPKLFDRSQFINSVMSGLTGLGFDPPIEAMMLHGLYRKHLLTIFEFEFPEHLGEILILLLKCTSGNPENNLPSPLVWLDVLNSMAQPASVHLKAPVREQLRKYALLQKMLQHQEILEISEMLSRHFTGERLRYGLYGLYPKCRNYMDVFVILLGMVGHALIVSMLNTHQGLLGDELCEKIWPYLQDMFAPWLIPYSMPNLKGNMAAWIQQLADDRSVLLPWIPADGNFAKKVIVVFYECITFMIQTLPVSTRILVFVWQWYVTSFAHNSVKDHILFPIHETLHMLPWHNFWPSTVDLELMLRVVDQYLPECHTFLGHIFVSVNWQAWLNNFVEAPREVKAKVYQCFFNLIVKLSNEPNIRKNHTEKVKSLIIQAENFDWSILDPKVFQSVTDWYVMSCDCGVIFKKDPIDLDCRVLHFLKMVSEYNSNTKVTIETLAKRHMYVKMNVKLLQAFTNRHKNNITSRESDIYNFVLKQLNDAEIFISEDEEMKTLLSEIVAIANIPSISHVTSKVILKWIENKNGDEIIVRTLLKISGVVVVDYDILSDIYEAALTAYFSNRGQDSFDPTWNEVGRISMFIAGKQKELENILVGKSAILTLTAVLYQKTLKCDDYEYLANICLDWMANLKYSDSLEPKLALMWLILLKICKKYCDKNEPASAAILHKFSQGLIKFSENKSSTGWGRGLLTTLGINKQETVTLNFRFIARALAAYILAQLPDMKGQPQVVRKVQNAPCRAGQPGGNTECPKIMMSIDFGQSQGKIKDCAVLVLKQIQDSANSLHNVEDFLLMLLKQFYTNTYLKDFG